MLVACASSALQAVPDSLQTLVWSILSPRQFPSAASPPQLSTRSSSPRKRYPAVAMLPSAPILRRLATTPSLLPPAPHLKFSLAVHLSSRSCPYTSPLKPNLSTLCPLPTEKLPSPTIRCRPCLPSPVDAFHSIGGGRHFSEAPPDNHCSPYLSLPYHCC